MATILLSAAGAAVGSSVGGTLLGLSMTAVGRFAGASLGRVIDQRVMGAGSDVVESGRIDRFRLTGTGEGHAMGQVFGRQRVGGHVIWASHFVEHVSESGGGKGGPRRPKTREFSYTVSMAVALCEGEITHISRVWADGAEVAKRDLDMRVYTGSRDQMPDPKMEAVEGTGAVPAYRGTAYVVFEDLDLGRFGNRIPQFSFEVCRPSQPDAEGAITEVARGVQGVALVPGTGEYSLATSPVHFDYGAGKSRIANVNSASGETDLVTSLDRMTGEMPNCKATSLVVSWFGDDLRCGDCTLRPKVEQTEFDGAGMPWSVAGVSRSAADVVPHEGDRPIYGGTPADASVIEAIAALQEAGQAVMFYPFILMDQMADNTLPDPWSGEDEQAKLPWRGRITLSAAPGQAGSPDGTAGAEAEVAAFFGTASASDFAINEGSVTYSGPNEWSYRRFILHNAALCAAAGGVESFCIGSEMRSLTQIRGVSGFPAVAQLIALAAEARLLLGAGTKIGYAADWSEYFGYQPQDGSGDRLFHLDPLWADANIDFIGIDNYMPLSDWRDTPDHLDAEWKHIYNPDYLRANIEGGEGYDWYYHSAEARDAQIRTPITDDQDEPWIWRYKDIRNWWQNPHFDRVGGVRAANQTAWEPMSKPIWFTEIGCAAIDKGTNQPNKFLDPKSSESSLPHYSNGARDELMQAQYLDAMFSYWSDPDHNPISPEYDAPMLDMSRCFVWAWDARPYPWFPGNRGLWSDGENYGRGHWLNGRASGRSLASVVSEICRRAGVQQFDTSRLFGFVRGYALDDVAQSRQPLQTLMLRFAFDAVERDGQLEFVMREGRDPVEIDEARLVDGDEIEGRVVHTRAGESELVGRVRARFFEADGDYDILAEESVLPSDQTHSVAETDLPLVLTRGEGHAVVERWLAEAQIGREGVKLVLPPSQLHVGPGDVISLGADKARYRVDQVEQGPSQIIEAVRIEPDVYKPGPFDDAAAPVREFTSPVPVLPLFMDLPLLRGDEDPIAPHIAVTSDPWPGAIALYDSAEDADYDLNQIIAARSVVGVSETPLPRACPGVIDHGPGLEVRLTSGSFQSITDGQLLSGGNLVAIGDGSSGNWEVFQFRDAQMLGPDHWMLSHRLRGQAGSDGVMPDHWPVGSYVVLLNGTPSQITHSPTMRRIARHYRIGPAQRGYDDPSYRHLSEAFDGNGLRPYRPCHLRMDRASTGDVSAEWVRRTRIDGDGWDLPDVPLSEESESYLVRVRDGSTVLREEIVASPTWTYSAAAQSADSVPSGAVLDVAQISASFGPGPFVSQDLP